MENGKLQNIGGYIGGYIEAVHEDLDLGLCVQSAGFRRFSSATPEPQTKTLTRSAGSSRGGIFQCLWWCCHRTLEVQRNHGADQSSAMTCYWLDMPPESLH